MRENEFEKEVQQRMKEFDLRPSDEVWMEVERRIREEKKRRFIFWWPLLFLLVGGGIAAGILFANKKEKTGKLNAENNTEKLLQSTSVKKEIPKTVPAISNNDTPGITGSKNDLSVIKQGDTGSMINPVSGSKSGKPDAEEPALIKKQNSKKQFITKDKIVKTVKQNIRHDKLPAAPTAAALKPAKDLTDTTRFSERVVQGKKEKQQKDRLEPEKQRTDITNSDQQNPPVASVVVPVKTVVDSPDPTRINNNITVPEKKELQQQNLPENLTPVIDSINKEKKEKQTDNKSKKWDWGITISTGRSRTVNGLNLFEKSLNASPPAGLSISPPFADSRSAVFNHSSLSFEAGFFIKRPLSKKLDINIGLNYSYLSTGINVGNRVDSVRIINNNISQGVTVSNFYRQGSNAAYKNHYHFLNVSADLSWRIINSKKLKVYWENGLGYSRLLGSNMLHFDGSIPGYYIDNNLLTRNHLIFYTGFSVPLGKRVMISPFVSYSLTPVLKNSSSSRLHFFNYGIRARFLLNKR